MSDDLAVLMASMRQVTCPACGYHVAVPFYDGGRAPLATLAWPASAEEARGMARLASDFVSWISRTSATRKPDSSSASRRSYRSAATLSMRSSRSVRSESNNSTNPTVASWPSRSRRTGATLLTRIALSTLSDL